MRVVVDTSVIIAVLVNEDSKPALLAATSGCRLVAPGSIHWEIGNALALQVRRSKITMKLVSKLLEILGRIPIQTVEIDLGKAISVARSEGIYAYDAYMIVCAMQHRLPLITLDRKLQAAAVRQGVAIHPIEQP